MRVPHTIPINTLRAFAASDQTLALLAERYRTTRAEDLSWDELVPPALTSLCVQVLAANFVEHFQVLPYLLQQDFDYLLEILSVELPLVIVAPIIENGIYWQRCCVTKWPNLPLDISKHGDSWKRLYIERYCEEYIEDQEPGYIDWMDVNAVTTFCAPFVFKLDIRELKTPRKWEPEPNLPDKCIRGRIDPDHIDLNPVLANLVNLDDLSIRYGFIQCGIKYNPESFRISVADVTNLGEGLKKLPVLTKFRLHRCAIEDIRINILVEALMSCPSIEHLEISHCKFGDTGAKSLAKLLLEHKNLKNLIIQNNRIGEEGGTGLAYALQHEDCCSIQILDLNFNKIGDDAGLDFSSAIAKNKTLKELNLSGIGITSEAAIKIADALLFSPSITRIMLSNNTFDMTVNEHFITAVQNNKRLVTVDIRNCGLGQEAETTIHKFLANNRLRYRPVF